MRSTNEHLEMELPVPVSGKLFALEKPRAPKYYDKDARWTLFRAVRGEAIKPAVLQAGTYGLRRSEVLGFNCEVVDFRSRTITIEHPAVKCCRDTQYRGYGDAGQLPVFPSLQRM